MLRRPFAVLLAFIAAFCFAPTLAFGAEPPGARRMDPDQAVWVDAAEGVVYVDGQVVLREGVLEMFACPAGTKEHESVVAVDATAFLVHTALLAIGAEPGTPVRFEPEYRPPTGTRVEVAVQWTDEDGEAQQTEAQQWVRDIDSGEAMRLPFVFAGSSLWTDPQTGRQHYLADSGDLICVSNFGTAMLDVPAPSTQANDELLFEPFTERIPPVETPVRLVLSVGKADPVATAPASRRLSDALAVLASAEVGSVSAPELRTSWRLVAEAPPAEWRTILEAMDDESPLAGNWLRSAISAASDDATGALDAAAAETLERAITDDSLADLARRTAYELLIEHRPGKSGAFLARLVDDADEQLRYNAVRLLLDNAETNTGDDAVEAYRVALAKARVLSQVEAAAGALEDLGQPQKLTEVMGFVTKWRLMGPFDNTDGAGFDRAYPPEAELSVKSEFTGKPGDDGNPRELGWVAFASTDRLAEIDMNTALEPEKSATGYAWVKVISDQPREAEVRFSSRNATRLWVNGQMAASNEVYHDGSQVDQYRAAVSLRAGENDLLLKVCQNDQPQPWAQRWLFQLRVCDATGGRIDSVTYKTP